VRDDDVEMPFPTVPAPHGSIIDAAEGLVELMKRQLLADQGVWRA